MVPKKENKFYLKYPLCSIFESRNLSHLLNYIDKSDLFSNIDIEQKVRINTDVLEYLLKNKYTVMRYTVEMLNNEKRRIYFTNEKKN